MPWHVAKSEQCPASEPFAVIKDDDGEVVGCHDTETEAKAQMGALYANEEKRMNKPTFRDIIEAISNALRPVFGTSDDQERATAMALVYDQIVNALYTRNEVDGTWARLLDVYLDNGSTYAIIADDGKLYRASVVVSAGNVTLGEWQQVMETHQPLGRSVIRQMPDGGYRWFSISATSVLNRVGEIDSRDLFDSFAEHVNTTGEYPLRDFFHGGENFRTGQCDFIARDGNCLITSGVYDNTEIAQLEVQARLAGPDYYGDSIAYIPTQPPELVEIGDGVRIPVYRAGKLRFVSTVSQAGAASWFTTGDIEREVDRMTLTGMAWQEFVKLFGDDEDKARLWMTENVDATNRAIEENGQIARSTDEETEANTETETEERANDAETEAEAEDVAIDRELELDDDMVNAIAEQVMASDKIAGMLTALDEAVTQLSALSENMDGLTRTAEVRQHSIESRLDTLERDESDKQRQWSADLGQRQRERVRITYRPRDARSPDAGNGNQTESLADRALEALSGMPSY